MAKSVLVDTSFLVALLNGRDNNHPWSVLAADRHPPPWTTCEAVLSEAFHLLGSRGGSVLAALLRRRALITAFALAQDLERVLKLMEKYANVPMSFADACLVRLSETALEPVLLTTDTDFRIYRRLGRQAVPVVMPEREAEGPA
jgi:uncharacterized protein